MAISADFVLASHAAPAACRPLAIRLREAQRLMREGRLNLLDVALACSFGSQSHFNHRFKEATGLRPRAWRTGLG